MSDNPKATFNLTFDGEVVEVELEFKFSDNAEEFFDVMSFVEMVSHGTLAMIKGSTSSE